MRQRILLIFKLYVAAVCIFLVQKPLFMLYNAGEHPEVGVTDYLDVMWHGLTLDLTTAGYITAVPWLLVLVSWFFKNDWWRKRAFPLGAILKGYYAVIGALIAIIFLSDMVLYGFWGFKIDSTVFVYTDKPGDVIASVSTWFLVGGLVALLFLVAAHVWAFNKLLPKEPLRNPSSAWSSLTMIIVGGLLFLAIRGGVEEGTASVSNVYYSSNQYLNHSAVNPAFSMFYSLIHQQDFSKEFRYFDEDKAKGIVEGIYPEKNKDGKGVNAADSISHNDVLTDTLLSNQRPNVLLVVWEGCGAKMVESLGGDRNVTPNLDRIAKEGVMFTNCYSNSFRTDRGLVSLMTGWLGMPSASLMKIPNKANNLPGIARSLWKEGYATDFWYGGDITFTNMGGFMISNGFESTHADGDFSMKDRSYSKWGVVDGIMLDTLASVLVNRKQVEGKPWFTSVLTLSSHEPWEVPYHRLDKEKQNSFAYTDDCLGKFISRLKASEQWKNLLVIIVPDHGVVAAEGDTKSSQSVIHVPLVMTGGAVRHSGKRIGTIMNQSDLAATLLAQMGIDHSEFAFSRNVLGSEYKNPTAFHSSPDDATFVDSSGITTYDLRGKTIVFSSDSKTDSRRIDAVKAILQTLYDRAADL